MVVSAYTVVFIILGLITVAGALGVVLGRNVVHCALFLVLSLVGVAALFVLLFAGFLALVQVLIYGGAVTILLLFALMMTRVRGGPATLDNPQKPVALVAGLVFLGVLLYTLLQGQWLPNAPLAPVSLEKLGESLFTQWAVPFEVASLVLLVALMGAIVIARREEQE